MGILVEMTAKTKEAEDDVDKLERMASTLGMENSGGDITAHAARTLGAAYVEAQSSLKSSLKAIEPHMLTALGVIKLSLQKLVDRNKKGTTKLEKSLGKDKNAREKVLSE